MTKYIPSCVHHATVCSPHTLVLLTVSKFALHFGGKDCHRLSSDKKEQLDRVHEVKKKKKTLTQNSCSYLWHSSTQLVIRMTNQIAKTWLLWQQCFVLTEGNKTALTSKQNMQQWCTHFQYESFPHYLITPWREKKWSGTIEMTDILKIQLTVIFLIQHSVKWQSTNWHLKASMSKQDILFAALNFGKTNFLVRLALLILHSWEQDFLELSEGTACCCGYTSSRGTQDT